MSETKSTESTTTSDEESQKQKITPLRCLSGAIISGGLTIALYSLMNSIITTYATKPIASTNTIAVNIASAVRTLVIGVSALGTGVFGFVTVGLLLLAIQITIQDLKGNASKR